MDNFLTRLVDRTLGNITTIQPVIAPMFAVETLLMQEELPLQPLIQEQARPLSSLQPAQSFSIELTNFSRIDRSTQFPSSVLTQEGTHILEGTYTSERKQISSPTLSETKFNPPEFNPPANIKTIVQRSSEASSLIRPNIDSFSSVSNYVDQEIKNSPELKSFSPSVEINPIKDSIAAAASIDNPQANQGNATIHPVLDSSSSPSLSVSTYKEIGKLSALPVPASPDFLQLQTSLNKDRLNEKSNTLSDQKIDRISPTITSPHAPDNPNAALPTSTQPLYQSISRPLTEPRNENQKVTNIDIIPSKTSPHSIINPVSQLISDSVVNVSTSTGENTHKTVTNSASQPNSLVDRSLTRNHTEVINSASQPNSLVDRSLIRNHTESIQPNSSARFLPTNITNSSDPLETPSFSRKQHESKTTQISNFEVPEIDQSKKSGPISTYSQVVSSNPSLINAPYSTNQPIASRIQRTWVLKNQPFTHTSQIIQPSPAWITPDPISATQITNTKNIRTSVNQSMGERQSLFSPTVINSRLLKSSIAADSISKFADLFNPENRISNQSSESPPAIQISIGRVEVRNTQATSKPQPSRSPSSQQRSPALSLENYLKQRNRS